eukprot:351951-Chlamydomonas_euryale.AAC.4
MRAWRLLLLPPLLLRGRGGDGGVVMRRRHAAIDDTALRPHARSDMTPLPRSGTNIGTGVTVG